MGSRTKEARHRAFIKTKYGLTGEQYQALVASQDGKCALCATAPRRLVIDHNHTTGKVRGLLCDACNIGVGFYEERLQHNPRLAAYLGAN